MAFRIAGLSRRLAADADGGVAIILALSLPVILGASALALEYGSAMITRSENQRTSDIAAFAAAHAYNRDPSARAADKRGAAGDYELTECGIGSNSEIAANGFTLDTTCGAPSLTMFAKRKIAERFPRHSR